MKRSGCKTVTGLLIVQALFILSTTAFAQEIEKNFSKEFNTQGVELLDISNRYGEVVVENWNENKVSIDVTVTVEHPSKDKAEKYLSMIEVIFEENDNTIEARTEIDKNFSFRGNGNSKFSIDYVVKMPTDLNLKLSNKYGSVEIGELSGHVDIAVKYGSLYAAKLTRGKEEPLNSISLAYSNGELVDLGWSELTLRYVGKLNVGTAKALLVDSRYSKLYVDEVGSIVSDSKYDHIEVSALNNFVAEAGYTGFVLGTVTGKIDISTGYGSIRIEDIKQSFELIDIEAKYCQVKLQFQDEASYMLNVNTSYGGISFDEDNAEIINRIYENNHKFIEAKVGTKSSNSAVKIKTSYGSVKVY